MFVDLGWDDSVHWWLSPDRSGLFILLLPHKHHMTTIASTVRTLPGAPFCQWFSSSSFLLLFLLPPADVMLCVRCCWFTVFVFKVVIVSTIRLLCVHFVALLFFSKSFPFYLSLSFPLPLMTGQTNEQCWWWWWRRWKWRDGLFLEASDKVWVWIFCVFVCLQVEKCLVSVSSTDRCCHCHHHHSLAHLLAKSLALQSLWAKVRFGFSLCRWQLSFTFLSLLMLCANNVL